MKFIQNVPGETIEQAHLRKLGVNSTEEINDWFRKSYKGGYWIQPMEDILNLLSRFKEKTIYILGDYDVDGISATSIMVLGLKWAGFKDIRFKIPRRCDGFGISNKLINEINSENQTRGVKSEDTLLITVDNGIAGIEQVKLAKELGFSVIITDHHEPVVIDGEVVLPNADIIFDANAIDNSADFNGYCGAGNAYKIMMHLLKDDKRRHLLTPIAMFATFCDQMVLREENYVIAYNGLKMVNEQLKYCLPSIRALAKVFGIEYWTSISVLFSIGPALNALERIEDGAAEKGVELLTCTDFEKCLKLVGELKQYNELRKALTDEAIKRARETILEENPDINNIKYPIILNIPNVKFGIVGVLAGKIQESYGLPVGIFTNVGNGELKGSFRAPEGYDIKEHLDRCAKEFTVYGGHAPAAGASLMESNFDNMKKVMQSTVKTYVESKDQEEYRYDVEITNEELELAISKNEKFQPLGNGNEDLIFKVTGFDVIQNYGDYKKEMRNRGVRLKSISSVAVGFGKYDKAKDINGPCKITLYGTIAKNYWRKPNGDMIITPQIQFDELEIQEYNKQIPSWKSYVE